MTTVAVNDRAVCGRYDVAHRAWIDLADEVIAVRKPDGTVGESTAAEVEYARERGKPVRWWPGANNTERGSDDDR